MRFKIDENLPYEVALFFRTEGFEAATVAEQKARGVADRVLSEMCQRHDEILVTMDLDFTDLYTYPPDECPGFLVIQTVFQNKPDLLAFLRQNSDTLFSLELTRHLTILSEHGIQIYPGE